MNKDKKLFANTDEHGRSLISVLPKYNNGRIKELPDIYYVPVIDGKEGHECCETEDIAYLVGLAKLYDGNNSRFATFALRMLNINSRWAE